MSNAITAAALRRPGAAVLVLLEIGLALLLARHWVHALGVLPYLVLLASPLMHLFHGHHHGHGEQHRPRPRGTGAPRDAAR